MFLMVIRGGIARPVVACLVAILLYASAYASAETGAQAETIERAKRATVGILEDTQDPRTPEKPGKIVVRGTGFHLRDGYVVTARHAVERNSPSGPTLPTLIRLITMDLNELPAEMVSESAYLDVVVYRIAEKNRSLVTTTVPFAAADVGTGTEVFTVGYPMGWGPTMAFGRIGNANTFLQTVETRLLQADLSACSGNSGGPLYNQG